MKRLEILEALEATREHCVCAYIGRRCDCKYGIANIVRGKSRMSVGVGEQNGCPEMREAIAMLRNMTDVEWSKIERRIARAAKAAYKQIVLTK